MKLNDLKSLFIHELKDLYSAEKQLTKALPKMAKAASHDGLRDAFEHHLQETETQIKRLDDIFAELDASPGGARCAAMKGLIEEGKELLTEDGDASVRDAGLICAAQRVEHYEIAGYGALRSLAQQLGMTKLARELQATLDEEKEANEKLNELALSGINADAMSASGDGAEE
jgi:ferritin-like metal-binding protein YciE